MPVVGGPSGSGLTKPDRLHELAARLGIADLVRFQPPVDQERLADWYRAATVAGRAVVQRVLRAGRGGGAGVRYAAGTAEQITERLAGILEPGLTDYIVLQLPTGDMTLDEARRTVEIFASEVKPQLETASLAV